MFRTCRPGWDRPQYFSSRSIEMLYAIETMAKVEKKKDSRCWSGTRGIVLFPHESLRVGCSSILLSSTIITVLSRILLAILLLLKLSQIQSHSSQIQNKMFIKCLLPLSLLYVLLSIILLNLVAAQMITDQETNPNPNTPVVPVNNANTGIVGGDFNSLPSDPTDPTDLPDVEPVPQISNQQVDTDQQAAVSFVIGTSGGVPTTQEIAAEAVLQNQDLGVGNEPVNNAAVNINTQQQAPATELVQPLSPLSPNDDRNLPNIRLSNAPTTGAYSTGNAPVQRITPPMQIVEEIYRTYAPKLEEARARRFPGGYPGLDVVPEEPPQDIWDQSAYTSIIIRPETWQKFFNQTTQFGYGGTDLVEYVWWACSNIQNYRISLKYLIVPLGRYLRRKNPALKDRLDDSWRKLGRMMRYVSNRDSEPDGKATEWDRPGLCDSHGGYLGAPTPQQWKTSKKGRDELKNTLLKKLLEYQELAPREILLTDNLFVDAFSMIVASQRAMVTWLTDDFTPLIREINDFCCKNRDLLANSNMRPAGIWDRKTMGYKSYWHEKYGKIYHYIPQNFPYWPAWDRPKIEKKPEMLETLIYATHATAAGLTRGALSFLTELFVDFSAKVWNLGQYAGLPDPDFGYASASGYKGSNKLVTFTLSPKFMLGAAERGNSHFLYGPVYPSESPVELENWNDAAEIERNSWRDKELAMLKEDRDLFDREKAAEPDTVPLSGLSTGASTPPQKPGNAPGQKLGNKGTQYRAVKKPYR
ncbi:hypothetical protein TWF751_001007 [Orbilia oligospora]|nr:hypothetical protein TWF751_001007 [Orbilia oligospora]